MPGGERIPNASEMFRVYTEEFLLSAIEELGRAGLDTLEIEVFSKSFTNVCAEEVALVEQGRGRYFEDIDDSIDKLLRRAIAKLDNKKLQDDLGMLLELRAEQRKEHLEESGGLGGTNESKKIN
jgi:hypothetical protein